MSAAEPPSAAEPRSSIVVGGSLAARQWEHYLSGAELYGERHAWVTPPVVTYAAWLESLWLAATDGASMPLTPAQSQGLWRRVIGESTYAAELVGDAGVADWAARAWELLHRWRIEPRREHAGAADVDYAAFLAWCRRYRELLDDHGWVDRAELEQRIAATDSALPGRVALADLEDPYPARAALLERLSRGGMHVEELGAPNRGGSREAIRLPDAAAELRTALCWAQRRFDVAPECRVALVVPGLAARRAEVERLTAAARTSDIPVWSSGSALSTDPAIGGALCGLALLAPSAPYATFGRWLRNFFFAATPEEAASRARLDAELRSDLRSQVPFRHAYFECGLADTLEGRAPATATALRAALRAVGARARATPGFWAHVWTRALAALGWQSPSRAAALLGWQSALDEVARLTPILGEITFAAALQELERVLERPEPTATPLRGIHLLANIDDVGPGYEAVWVTGFTDAYWPEATRGNPLLPRALQRSLGMPRASPQAARAAAERSFARLLTRAPALVVSWPARVYDYDTEPSPVIRDWPLLSNDVAAGRGAHAALARAPIEIIDDVPPPVHGSVLFGGAGMLGRQARCPLRAFAQYRLGARELEEIGFGVSARIRGIAIHRAAQLVYAHVRDRAGVSSVARATLDGAVERALEEAFLGTRTALESLFELEAERLRAVLTLLLEREAAREPFEIAALEQELEAKLDRWTLRLRVDRLDRPADGRIAILDYKTGEGASASDWFATRLRDAQVPLYAIQPATAVGAAVLVKVAPTAVSYLGIWEGATFPGRPARLPLESWPAQLERWRYQLEQLAAEFAAGDTRIFLAERDDALGAYAPLSRLHEQLRLTSGAPPSS